jgi:hypothetical protein
MSRFLSASALFFVLMLASTQSFADGPSKDAKLHELATLRGLKKNFEQQNEIARQQSRAFIDKIVSDLFAKYPQIPNQTGQKIRAIADTYMERATKPLDSEKAEASWCKYYGVNVTEAELDQILAYYRSSVGQKDVSAALNVEPTWSTELNTERHKITQVAIDQYIKDLTALMAEIPPEKKQ